MIEVITTQNPTLDAAARLEASINEATRPTLLVISGGSSLTILEHVKTEEFPKDCSHITLTVLDDRCTPQKEENNFHVLSETDFFKELVKNGAAQIGLKLVDTEACEAETTQFELSITAWRTEHPNGFVTVLCGVGHDGHIAGIMPGYQDESPFLIKLAHFYEVPPSVNEFTKRVTLTARFFREFPNEVIVYAVGEAKRDALEKVLIHHAPYDMVPAGILRELQNVQLYTDLEIELPDDLV
jgi:6-phosphogluconolactonase/glucosamine-6-phosphate isomerase/deaminase